MGGWAVGGIISVIPGLVDEELDYLGGPVFGITFLAGVVGIGTLLGHLGWVVPTLEVGRNVGLAIAGICLVIGCVLGTMEYDGPPSW